MGTAGGALDTRAHPVASTHGCSPLAGASRTERSGHDGPIVSPDASCSRYKYLRTITEDAGRRDDQFEAALRSRPGSLFCGGPGGLAVGTEVRLYVQFERGASPRCRGWEEGRNERGVNVKGQFTTADARFTSPLLVESGQSRRQSLHSSHATHPGAHSLPSELPCPRRPSSLRKSSGSAPRSGRLTPGWPFRTRPGWGSRSTRRACGNTASRERPGAIRGGAGPRKG